MTTQERHNRHTEMIDEAGKSQGDQGLALPRVRVEEVGFSPPHDSYCSGGLPTSLDKTAHDPTKKDPFIKTLPGFNPLRSER